MADLPALPPMEELQRMFFEAARRGDEAALGALIRAGVDLEGVNERGHSALVLASYNERPAATALLLDAGASPDGTDGGDTPLTGVAFKGHLGIATLLLDCGADPNARNAAGRTALMTAATYGQGAIVELLLARGADPAIADTAGARAHDLARAQGHAALAERLAVV